MARILKELGASYRECCSRSLRNVVDKEQVTRRDNAF